MDDPYVEAGRNGLAKLDPLTRAKVLENAKEARKLHVRSILRQHYECSRASIEVVRKENVVTINWAIDNRVKNPHRHVVCGTVADIALNQSTENYSHSIICNKNGSGSIELALEEGHAYYFTFAFLDGEGLEKNRDKKDEGLGRKLVETILFQAAIPLADRSKELLRKAEKLEFHPEERARHEVEKVLNLQDTFDELCGKAVEKIKAKNLSPKETKKRIQNFMEKLETMKDEFGI